MFVFGALLLGWFANKRPGVMVGTSPSPSWCWGIITGAKGRAFIHLPEPGHLKEPLKPRDAGAISPFYLLIYLGDSLAGN